MKEKAEFYCSSCGKPVCIPIEAEMFLCGRQILAMREILRKIDIDMDQIRMRFCEHDISWYDIDAYHDAIKTFVQEGLALNANMWKRIEEGG